jgi:hypothetical protein
MGLDGVPTERHCHGIVDVMGRDVAVRVDILQSLNKSVRISRTCEALPGPKSASVRPPHLRKLNALLASLMSQPPPSGGELGRLTPIYRWLAFAGLRQAEQSFELFEFF